MRVLGIGVDIVDTARIEALVREHGEAFLRRVFGEAEVATCQRRRDPWPCYAARFAAKEAVSKAFGTGITGECGWLDIEVRNLDTGAPEIHLSGPAAELAKTRSVAEVKISLSHTDEQAIAFATLVG